VLAIGKKNRKEEKIALVLNSLNLQYTELVFYLQTLVPTGRELEPSRTFKDWI
jgi:hypothetical protein